MEIEGPSVNAKPISVGPSGGGRDDSESNSANNLSVWCKQHNPFVNSENEYYSRAEVGEALLKYTPGINSVYDLMFESVPNLML